MARTDNLTNFLTDISTAIKQKIGDNTPIPAANFDSEIAGIQTGGTYQDKVFNITQNGNYLLNPDNGYDAFTSVNIGTNVDINSFQEYQDCQEIADEILGTTATYTELEYIEATGTQWINTGVKPSLTLNVELEYAPSAISAMAIFGAYWIENGYFLMTYQNKFRFHSRNNVVDSNTISAGTKYSIYTDITKLVVNETQFLLGNKTNADSNADITIFYVQGGGVNNVKGQGKLYSFKMNDSGLIRDFIPVKDKNNIVCLYDKVTEEFYYNAGTGNFTAGPVKEEV